jgi:hypothetical protein
MGGQQQVQTGNAGIVLEVHNYGCDGCGMNPIIGPRWMCNQCPGSFDLCDICHWTTAQNHIQGHSFRRMEMRVNDEGAPVSLSTQIGDYYCGRELGCIAIPGSDGRCGPNDGPQCQSCVRFQVAVSGIGPINAVSPMFYPGVNDIPCGIHPQIIGGHPRGAFGGSTSVFGGGVPIHECAIYMVC